MQKLGVFIAVAAIAVIAVILRSKRVPSAEKLSATAADAQLLENISDLRDTLAELGWVMYANIVDGRIDPISTAQFEALGGRGKLYATACGDTGGKTLIWYPQCGPKCETISRFPFWYHVYTGATVAGPLSRSLAQQMIAYAARR